MFYSLGPTRPTGTEVRDSHYVTVLSLTVPVQQTLTYLLPWDASFSTQLADDGCLDNNNKNYVLLFKYHIQQHCVCLNINNYDSDNDNENKDNNGVFFYF